MQLQIQQVPAVSRNWWISSPKSPSKKTQSWFKYHLAWYLHYNMYIPMTEDLICDLTTMTCQRAHKLYLDEQKMTDYDQLTRDCLAFAAEQVDHDPKENIQFPLCIDEEPIKTIYLRCCEHYGQRRFDLIQYPLQAEGG